MVKGEDTEGFVILLKIYLVIAFYCGNYNGRCLLIILGDELYKGICNDNT